MKQRAKYVLALTLVATTLCAGRLFAADQNARAENRPMAEKLVDRLTRVFSHTLSRNPLVVQRQMVSPVVRPLLIVLTDRRFCLVLSPLQLPLPPPLL